MPRSRLVWATLLPASCPRAHGVAQLPRQKGRVAARKESGQGKAGAIVQGPHLQDIIRSEKKGPEFLEHYACARAHARARTRFFRGTKTHKTHKEPRRESMMLTTRALFLGYETSKDAWCLGFRQ
jgi:hypothetical protein